MECTSQIGRVRDREERGRDAIDESVHLFARDVRERAVDTGEQRRHDSCVHSRTDLRWLFLFLRIFATSTASPPASASAPASAASPTTTVSVAVLLLLLRLGFRIFSCIVDVFLQRQLVQVLEESKYEKIL